MRTFTFTGFADEIDEKIDLQFEHLKRLGMEYFEVRFVDGKNIADFTEEEAILLKEKMDKNGIKASSIGSPIGKIKITDDFEEHLDKLRGVIRTAKILGTRYIRVFSYYLDDKSEIEKWHDEVIYRMKRMTELAEKEDVILLHENEKDIWGELPEQCDRIIREVNSPNLRAVFDPANFIQAGATPYPDAFNIMKEHIEYMHIKDAHKDGTVTVSGDGIGEIEKILRGLYESGWKGFVSLEPHLGAFQGLANLEGDNKTVTTSLSSPEKFTLAYDSLKKITRSITARVRYGIVGVGNMGTAHAKSFMAGKVDEGVLTALCDIDEERRATARELFPDVEIFDNAEALFGSGLVDVAVIAVPHYDHPALVKKAFEYGLSVITEKPVGVCPRCGGKGRVLFKQSIITTWSVFSATATEPKTPAPEYMNEAAEKSDKLFGIMYNQRTNPIYQKLKNMITSGELGKIRRVEWTVTNWYRPQAYHDSASWRSTWATEGGGTLINQNPHQLDLWQWLFGMPKRIYSHTYFGKYRNIEVEDEVTAFMEYENGMTGVYITSIAEAPGTNRLEISAEMGRIVVENNVLRFDRLEMSEPEFDKINTIPFGEPEVITEYLNVPAEAGPQHVGIFNDFTSAVLYGTPLLAPGAEGVKGLTISNAMHYSAWTDAWVDIENFPHDDFYRILQEKISSSTIVKIVRKASADLDGTY